jgi:serine/threonine-protein kinase
VLASRYRVVALLGQGGMGEVYRADDLTLGQPVALKFLPPGVADSEEQLARFRTEVRTARQVSHPNVCRVYDIAEAEGHHFLSMEYVDGEDLASLLRRIGRLPADKGIEIARQLCAGLAAAHDRGVLHRDLKPANVMIDGRGHARIADFGIAAMIGGETADRLAGTPAYLAPELLAGQPPTIKSDVYALGLVLHEIFTGKPVFAPGGLLDIVKAQRERTTSRTTTTAPDLDPAIDRVIARCLESEPAARPSSALAVAAALPGGDPLAAALARGETPAPEVVAAAGGEGALRPAVAASVLATTLALLVVNVWLMDQTSLINIVPMPLRPEVLRDRSEHLLGQIGYTDPPGDVASGFELSPFGAYVQRLQEPGPRWERARRGQPSALRFWYRRSPGPLVGQRFASGGRVSSLDPPQQDLAGMITLQLDTHGRLLRFFAMPPRERPTTTAEPDWAPLFAAAGFDAGAFRETPSQEAPPEDADVRRAWEGVYPDSPDVRIRIEAAAANGRPFYFRVMEPWMGAQPPPRGRPWAAFLAELLLVVAGLSLGVWLAVRNLRLGRGDMTGANRVGVAVFGLSLAGGLLGADYAVNLAVLRELGLRLLTWAAAAGIAVALFYLAIEPPVRRRWPHLLIGWTRFTRGAWRDPRVGREILFGLLAAMGVILLARGHVVIAARLDLPADFATLPFSAAVLGGGRFLAARLLQTPVTMALSTLTVLLVLFTVTLVVRRPWISAVVLAAFATWANTVGSPMPLFSAPFQAAGFGIFFTVLLRVGLLAHVTAGSIIGINAAGIVTMDPSVWYAPYGWVLLGLIVAPAIYGFRTSLGGRRLLSRGVLDD